MQQETDAEFTVELQPAGPELDGTGRFDLTKTWTGGMAGMSRGVMLSAGDPAAGSAGYVAIERFDGALDGREGSCVLLQLGTMAGDDQVLRFVIAPGSGTQGLTGVTGTVDLTVAEGRHRVRVRYSVP